MNPAPAILPFLAGRPAVPAQPDLKELGEGHPSDVWLRWLPVFAPSIYLYFVSLFRKAWSANEVPRVFLTQEIRRPAITLWIDGRGFRVAEEFTVLDVAQAPNHHIYPDKAPGPSLLAVPHLRRGSALRASLPARVHLALPASSSFTIPAWCFLPFFLGMARRFAPDERGLSYRAGGVRRWAHPRWCTAFSSCRIS